MRGVNARNLVGALVLTVALAGACRIESVGDGPPAEAGSGATEQTEASGYTASTAASPPRATVGDVAQPRAALAEGQPSGDDDAALSGRLVPSEEAEQSAQTGPFGERSPDAADQHADRELSARADPSVDRATSEGHADDQDGAQQDRAIAPAAEPDRLPAGVEEAVRRSYPDRWFVLHPESARGDLDGDGNEDYALHLEAQYADSPQPHLIVPVIGGGGAFETWPSADLGRRIIMDKLDIRNDVIEVSFLDRSPGEPLEFVTRRTALTLKPSADTPSAGAETVVTVTGVEPIDRVPTLQIGRPVTVLAPALDGIGMAASDRIELRERHPYVVQADESEVLVVTLAAPAGVWLEARLSDSAVLVPLAERTQKFAVAVPASGEWRVTVASSLVTPADYRLSIDVFPAALGEGIATRDPTGFWSSTRISPPAVPDDGPVVYLTFDDGPHPTYTPQVLDVLARHGAQATFFVVGSMAERWPLLIQRIAHEGHTLANHSWSHESLARVSKAAFDRSVGRTQEILGPLATPCLRPPYYAIGRFTEEWSNELGLRLVGWTYSPRDWEQRPAQVIADGLVARSSPGAIILLHDGGGPRSATVRGLDMALERLADSGYEFKAVCR